MALLRRAPGGPRADAAPHPADPGHALLRPSGADVVRDARPHRRAGADRPPGRRLGEGVPQHLSAPRRPGGAGGVGQAPAVHLPLPRLDLRSRRQHPQHPLRGRVRGGRPFVPRAGGHRLRGARRPDLGPARRGHDRRRRLPRRRSRCRVRVVRPRELAALRGRAHRAGRQLEAHRRRAPRHLPPEVPAPEQRRAPARDQRARLGPDGGARPAGHGPPQAAPVRRGRARRAGPPPLRHHQLLRVSEHDARHPARPHRAVDGVPGRRVRHEIADRHPVPGPRDADERRGAATTRPELGDPQGPRWCTRTCPWLGRSRWLRPRPPPITT